MKIAFQHIVASLLMAMLALGSLALSAGAGEYHVQEKDTLGGAVKRYIAIVQEQNRLGNTIVIDTPTCLSACTMFLLADSVQISERTTFGFHGPSATWTSWMSVLLLVPWPDDGLSDDVHDDVSAHWAAAYNTRWPGLGDWFLNRAADRYGMGFIYVKGHALNKALGVPLYGEKP